MLDFVQDHVNKQFVKISLTIDDSIFKKYTGDDASIPFCLCFFVGKNNTKQKKNLLMVLAKLDKKTIEDVYIPKRDDVYLAICEYSVLDDEDCTDKPLIAVTQPMSLADLTQGQKFVASLSSDATALLFDKQ